MAKDIEKENVQFTMKTTGDIDSPSLASDIDELRLEKISQRVTFITILIPVLIIIVLVIAYLDIKKRVSHTEDTGTMEFQKLSSDLESRFSSISLRQAKLEEDLESFSKVYNQSMTGINIQIDRMKKALDALGASQKQYTTQKNLDQARDDLVQRVDEVAASVDQADIELSTMTKELNDQIIQIGETLSTRNLQFSELEQKIMEINNEKIDKPTLDLQLKLATLKIQQDLKIQIDAIRKDLQTISEKVADMAKVPSGSSAISKPNPSKTADSGKESSSKPPDGIEEQSLGP